MDVATFNNTLYYTLKMAKNSPTTPKTIVIVGAGPAGSYAAMLLAQQGHSVDLYEENMEVGEPMQCTGIVTRALLDYVQLPDYLLLNELKYVKVVAPNGKSVKMRNTDIVIDRIGFDKYLAEQAQKAGATLRKRHRFTGIENGKLAFTTPEGKITRTADILIGADGPNSIVAQCAGIFGKREYYIGAQTRMKRSFDKEVFEVHLDVPMFFGWSVPENEGISRVGIGVFKKPHEHFQKILYKFNDEKYEMVGNQGGLIPVYDPKLKASTTIETVKGKIPVFLTGDAATFVKATTGGGIVQGLISSKILAECIGAGKFSEQDYERSLRWVLKKDLWLHLFIRDTLNKFKDKDYNELVELLSASKAKHILETQSRDYPSKFLIKLLVAQPRLLKFAPILLRRPVGLSAS